MNRNRLQRLLEARSLEETSADDTEVAAIWEAALREWTDSAVAGLSVAGAFVHVYQAGFRAAMAVVRAGGYRLRGAAGGHHHLAFYAAAALGDEELQRAADTLQNLRAVRHMALYGSDDELEPRDLDDARTQVGAFLHDTHRWLIGFRPALSGCLRMPDASGGT
jgi:hypothetical protein